MKKSLFFVPQVLAVAFAAGLFVGTVNGQGMGGGGGGFNTGSSGGGFGGGSQGGGSTGGRSSTGGSSGGSSSSLFNNSSSSSSSGSLFNSGSGSSGSGGTSGGGSGGAGTGTGNAETSIQTGKLGSATPITRGGPLERNTTGAYLINSNPDIIGGQPISNSNQFANLFSQIGRQVNQGGNFNQQGGRNTARPAIRIPLRLGFVPKPVSVPQFTAKFEDRIASLSGISAIGAIRVTMEGSTAVLRGVVASEQDRQLAAGVALLEPEVGTVRNELTVQAADADAEDPGSP